MEFSDSIQLSDFSTTPEGFLVSKARIARTGVLTYLAGEAGLRAAFPDRKPTDEIKIYRPPEEVFNPESLDSIAGKPITIDHPGEFVNADNAPGLVVGIVGDTLESDGEFVAGIVRIIHAEGVDAVRSGKRELSVGYNVDLDITAGVTPEGEAYDAIQRNIRGNHVALVTKGRCGPSCRLHDGANSSASTNCKCEDDGMTMKIVDCGGAQVEMSDAAAIALKSLTDKHVVVIQGKDAEIENLKKKSDDDDEKLAKAEAKADDAVAKLADAEAKISPEALAIAAKDRATLIADAAKLAPGLDCSTLDSNQIKVAALEAIDVDMTDRSETYIDAAFETRVDLAPKGGESASLARRLAGAQSEDAEPGSYRDAFIDSMRTATTRKDS